MHNNKTTTKQNDGNIMKTTEPDIRALILRGNTLYNLLPIRTHNAVSDWVGLSEQVVNRVNTNGELLDCCGRCSNITHTIIKELAGDTLTDEERQRLTDFALLVSDLNGKLFDTAEGIGTAEP